MEHLIEGVLELLFSFSKDKPDKMPSEVEYKQNFVVKSSRPAILVRIIASLVLFLVFALLWIVIKGEVRALFVMLTILSGIVLLLCLFSASFKCRVTQDLLKSSYWCFLKKELLWSDVKCVRVIEKTDEKDVIIAIYNSDGKCVIDFGSEMDNAWCVVKMAQEKNVLVENKKDLTLKQISHL